MAIAPKPDIRPPNANFSSGPCAKRPGFTLDALSGAMLGRSHRAQEPKARLAEVIERSRAMLGMPEDWRLGIVPASDTGAMEMALWSLLGARPVDVLAFESFGEGWATDVVKQLRLPDARVLSAPYGRLPDLAAVDFDRDVVFPWNGTTSGVRVPNGDWIASRPGRPDDLRCNLGRLRDGACRGTGSMSSPGPGRRCWAARRRTACWRCRRVPSHGWKHTGPRGRCRRCFA